MFNYKHTSTSPSNPTLTLVKELMDPLDFADVISATMSNCVVVADNAQCALIASDILLDHGIISKTIRGHFMDCYFLTIRYAT